LIPGRELESSLLDADPSNVREVKRLIADSRRVCFLEPIGKQILVDLSGHTERSEPNETITPEIFGRSQGYADIQNFGYVHEGVGVFFPATHLLINSDAMRPRC
jgi:hypothetical protein